MENANGLPKGQRIANGHAVGPRGKRVARPGFLFWLVNNLARISIWYVIITIAFRCPANLESCNATSPRICKPYFQLKQAASPYVGPYYDAHVAPRVEAVEPYYRAVETNVISPGWKYAKKYGAPRVAQAQALAVAQWDKNLHPQIQKWQSLARSEYDLRLGPHVDRTRNAVAPYYDIARTSGLQTYHEVVLPVYQFISPYALQGYSAVSTFTTETAVPSALWAWNKTYIFLDGTVWPQLRVIYAENVEPQLLKISKRLGRHNSGKKSIPKLAPEVSAEPTSKIASSFVKPAPSVSSTISASVQSSTVSSSVAATASSPTSQQPSVPPAESEPLIQSVSPPEIDENAEKEDPVRKAARETVAADLNDWQERYNKAAREGASEIDGQVHDITKRMIRRNARVKGKALVEDLSNSIASELENLRGDVSRIIDAAKQGTTPANEAEEELVKTVRATGMIIKGKALDVRAWREGYEAEMRDAITKAAESHFSILENIRDLALQKIGMKWAWMDGITYKDWAKYHQLKDRFEEGKGGLHSLIINHPSLEAAQLEAAGIEDDAMKIAVACAEELKRLKQDGLEKIKDATSQPIEASEKLSEASEKLPEPSENPSGATSQASEKLSDVPEKLSDASEELSGESEKLSSEASEEPSEAAEPTSAANLNPDEAGVPDVVSTVLLEVLEETPVYVGNTTELEEDGPPPAELPLDDAGKEIDQEEEQPLPSATSSVKPALFGAMAQAVPSRQPYIEDELDDDSDAGALDSIRDELRSIYDKAFASVTEAYSAHGKESANAAEAHPNYESAFATVTEAYSKALASASSRMDDALMAASKRLYGTSTTTNRILPTTVVLPPLPGWAHIESVAAEQLRQGRLWAEQQYESAKVAIGLATPTPSTPSEHMNRMLENARHNYYAGLGVAHDRYSQFLAAASSAMSSITATPTPTDLAGTASSVASAASETAASVASVAGKKAASAASVVGENVSSAAAAGYESAASVASVVGDNASSVVAAGYDGAAAAAGKVSETWDSVVDRLSVEIYGAPTPTPWYASAYSAVGEYAASATEAAGSSAAAATDSAVKQYEAVLVLVSELLVGKEPTFSESVLSRVHAVYSSGAASASSIASAASATAASAASEVTERVKGATDYVKEEL
ncbi:hypothetical protein OQA88_997 [Cercophora sp. LCS_1]